MHFCSERLDDLQQTQLNGGKTEVIWSGSLRSLASTSVSCLRVGGNEIAFQNCVKRKKLGDLIDSSLWTHQLISHVCKTTNFELMKIALVKSFLIQSAATQLVTSLTFSRLDSCNSLLAGLPSAFTPSDNAEQCSSTAPRGQSPCFRASDRHLA